jgi:uroporphyrinogen-III synthase
MSEMAQALRGARKSYGALLKRREEEAARLLSETPVVCIGPITAATARQCGLRVDAEAAEYTIPGLVEAVTHLLAGDPAKRSM